MGGVGVGVGGRDWGHWKWWGGVWGDETLELLQPWGRVWISMLLLLCLLSLLLHTQWNIQPRC